MSKVGPGEFRMMTSFWDGGRCHLTRSMALAEEAKLRGAQIGIVTSEKYAKEIDSLGIADNVYVIPNRPDNVPPPPYEFPLYSHAFRHAQRLRGLGFDNTEWLQQITAKEVAAIESFRPHVVVNDYRDTIRTAAQACDVPVVGITHTTGNVDGHTLAWWTQPTKDAVLPDCRDSFNEVRATYSLSPIEDEREMFSGDINLIPSSPSLEPLASSSPNSAYVGMISKWRPTDSSFGTIDPRTASKRVFSYVGEPTRPQYGYEAMLTEVMDREPGLGFYVVGEPSRYTDRIVAARRADRSVVIEPFIPGQTAIEDSALVLNHGGNGTVMLSLALGKPIICVGPPQSDCTSVFRGIEQAGAGIMLNHSESPLEHRPVPDLGEGVEIYGYWRSELSADRIHAAIKKVIENESFTLNAKRLGEELIALGGTKKAVELIRGIV